MILHTQVRNGIARSLIISNFGFTSSLPFIRRSSLCNHLICHKTIFGKQNVTKQYSTSHQIQVLHFINTILLWQCKFSVQTVADVMMESEWRNIP